MLPIPAFFLASAGASQPPGPGCQTSYVNCHRLTMQVRPTRCVANRRTGLASAGVWPPRPDAWPPGDDAGRQLARGSPFGASEQHSGVAIGRLDGKMPVPYSVPVIACLTQSPRHRTAGARFARPIQSCAGVDRRRRWRETYRYPPRAPMLIDRVSTVEADERTWSSSEHSVVDTGILRLSRLPPEGNNGGDGMRTGKPGTCT